MVQDIMVSVCVLTYAHESYIAKTLDSILSQKTNFRFKIVIGEDSGPGDTRKICERYAEQHADLIELLPSDINRGQTGNIIRTMLSCTSKYIALCEGDDYWVDDNKLQKQFDLLEAQPDKTMCFTKSTLIDQDGKDLGPNVPIKEKQDFTIKDIVYAGTCFIPTATLFFRNVIKAPVPKFFKEAISDDIAIHLILLSQGDAVCLHEVTAVYRKHPGGITKTQDHIDNAFIKLFKMYEDANEYYNYRFDDIFRHQLFRMTKTMLIYGSREKTGMVKLRHIAKSFPLYFKYEPNLNIKEVLYLLKVLFIPASPKATK